MDFIQLWNQAIKQVSSRTSDPSEQAIIQLFATQVTLNVDNNNLKFLCSSSYIHKIFLHHAPAFFDEVSHLLNKSDMGFSVEIANAVSPASSQPPLQPAASNFGFSQQQGFNDNGRARGLYQAERPSPLAKGGRLNHAGGSFNGFNGNGQIGSPNLSPAELQAQQGQFADVNQHPHSQAPLRQRPRFMRNEAINPNKTFENYVTDPDNRLLVATAVAVAANPGTSNYNPFYIYGGSGLGKTHLLFAIANRIRKERPDSSLVYIRAEEFIRHYVESMAKLGKKNGLDDQSVQFQDLYTENDVFIVDDIQNFIKAPKSRDVFFEIIADFIDRPNRQLILASDKAPGNLKGFSARLTSRFGSGVCCEVIPPSVETRAAIIMNKCKEIGITLSDDIVNYIASHIRSNVREIEGALKTLYTQYTISHDLTFDDAVRILSNLVNSSNQVLSMDSIKERVAKEFEVQVSSMESAERKKAVSMARSMAMALIRELIPSASLTDIGRAFNKDHSSVYEAVQRVKAKMESDPELASRYHRLKLALKND